jgi:large subunit ribosomal protein L37Ae
MVSFSAKYGTTPRRRLFDILSEMRKPHECPRCRFKKVKRLSVGLWLCRKCGYKFAGGAYSPLTKLGGAAQRAARAALTPSLTTSNVEEGQREKAAEPEGEKKLKKRGRKTA